MTDLRVIQGGADGCDGRASRDRLGEWLADRAGVSPAAAAAAVEHVGARLDGGHYACRRPRGEREEMGRLAAYLSVRAEAYPAGSVARREIDGALGRYRALTGKDA